MIPDWLSLIDVAVVAVVLLFALGGFQKGFAGQVAHIITFVAVGIFLFFAYPSIFSYFGRLFRNLNEAYMMWLILAGLVILAVFCFIFTSKLLASVLKTQISERTDRSLGFMLGLVRGALFTLLTMVFLVILGSENIYDTFRSKSQVGKMVCTLSTRIPTVGKSTIGENFNKAREFLIYQQEAGVVE